MAGGCSVDSFVGEEAQFVMKKEFQWLLEKQVPLILKEIESVLKACDEKFNIKTLDSRPENDQDKVDNILLKTLGTDVLKGYVKVDGDCVTNADLKFKVPKITNGNIHTYIKAERPWRLSQVQDAKNNLQMAIEKINEALAIETFISGMQINEMMDDLISDISRGKASLSVHEKENIPEIMSNGSLNAFKPSLPDEVVVNFHVSSHKLVFTVSILNTVSAPTQTTTTQKPQAAGDGVATSFEYLGKWYEIVNRYEVECVVPWLADAFRLIAVALQLCQQVKDKVGVFSTIMEEFQ